MSDIYIVLLSLVILLILVILTSFILKKLVIDVNAEAKKKYLLNVSRYEEETKDVPLKNNEQAKIINPFPSVSDPDNTTIINYFLTYRLSNEDLKTYNDLVNTKNVLTKLKTKELVKTINKDVFMTKVRKRVRAILEPLYCCEETISILNVLDILEVTINKYDPHIYIYVGSKEMNYQNLNSAIIMKYDATIYKGVKIYYHNQMYDYSIE